MDPEETFHSYRQKEPRGFSIRSAGAPKNLPVKYDASQDPWVRDRDSSMEESSNSSGSLHLSPIQSPPRADLPELPLSSFDLTQVASNSSSSNSNSNSNNEMTGISLVFFVYLISLYRCRCAFGCDVSPGKVTLHGVCYYDPLRQA